MSGAAFWLTGFAFGVLTGVTLLTVVFVWVAIKAVSRDTRAQKARVAASLAEAVRTRAGGSPSV